MKKEHKDMEPAEGQEDILYMEAYDGHLVRVPASRLEAWQKGQERMKRGEYKPNEELVTKILEEMGYGKDD